MTARAEAPRHLGSEEHPRTERPWVRSLSLLAVFLLPPVLLLGGLKPFVADVFRISSDSMAPTFEAGGHVLVDKLSYRLGRPGRGDLVALTEPESGEILLKRLAGVPGDTLALEEGSLVLNGRRQPEPYLDAELGDGLYYGPVTVPAGHVFVLADVRVNTVDSRTLDPIPEDELVGRVVLRLWPPVRPEE